MGCEGDFETADRQIEQIAIRWNSREFNGNDSRVLAIISIVFYVTRSINCVRIGYCWIFTDKHHLLLLEFEQQILTRKNGVYFVD